MATLGRNDPCWCGSGKKYKQCHLSADETRRRAERSLKTLPEWVSYHRNNLEEAALALSPEPDAFAGLGELELAEDPMQDRDARYWALYDAYGQGQPLFARLPIDGSAVGQRRAALRQSLVGSFASLLEVTECKRDKGLRLKDRLTGLERFVRDEELAKELDPMEVVLGRVIIFDKTPILLPGWRKVPFRKRKAMVADLTAQMQGADLPQDDANARVRWLKANAAKVFAAVRAGEAA